MRTRTTLIASAAAVCLQYASALSAAGPAPTVTAVEIASEQALGGEHLRDESIWITVRFTAPVVVAGDPTVSLIVGDSMRSAEYRFSGTSAEQVFEYRINAEDLDRDGVSIPANPIDLRRGTIRDASGADAVLLFPGGVDGDIDHAVDGRRTRPATVTGVSIESAPCRGRWYVAGCVIAVGVQFSKRIVVTHGGLPSLALQLGHRRRMAFADLGAPASDRLLFKLAVGEGDLDIDGLSIPGDALIANSLGMVDDPGGPGRP